MKKNMYFGLLILLFSFLISCDAGDDSIVIEQVKNVTIDISKWKNDSKGAYSIIHDDFGIPNANGIVDHAARIANDHNIDFAFGIITSEVDTTEWRIANELIDQGHEPVNHTHNHYCAFDVSWCPTKLWGVDDFDIEIDYSHQLILNHTGVTPQFFAFPFDQYIIEMLDYLKTKKYAGARSGAFTQGVTADFLNDNDTPYFGLKFYIHTPDTPLENLNTVASLAVQKGLWAIREMHGVADGSWGAVPISDYTDHIKTLNQLQRARELWVAPPSEIINYTETARNTLFTTNQEGTTLNVSIINTENKSTEISIVITFPQEIEVDEITTSSGENIVFTTISPNKVIVNINPSEIKELQLHFERR